MISHDIKNLIEAGTGEVIVEEDDKVEKYNGETEDMIHIRPEQLPMPEKSFGQLEREEQKRIEQRKQPPLFPDEDNKDG